MNVMDLLYRCFDAANNKLKVSVPDGITLSGSKERYVVNDLTVSTAVNAGQSETTNILASAGSIATLLGFWLNVPAPVGATTGTHTLQLVIGSATTRSTIFKVSAAFNVSLTIGNASGLGSGVALKANDLGFATLAEIQNAIVNGNIVFGSNTSDRLQLIYTNSTDANQTGTRYIYHRIKEKAVTW